jgi:hypothetical protein
MVKHQWEVARTEVSDLRDMLRSYESEGFEIFAVVAAGPADSRVTVIARKAEQ